MAAKSSSADTKPSKPLDFEKSLDKLSTLVETMEAGGLSLEHSLKQFETGVKLAADCEKALKSAEQKVQILTAGPQGESLQPFDSHEEGA